MTRDGSSFTWIAAAAGAAVALMAACTLPTGGTGEGTTTTTTTTGPGGAGGDIGAGGSGGASTTTTGPGGGGGAGGAGGAGPTCGAPWATKQAVAVGFGSKAAVAVDPAGPVVFAGTFKGTTDIDGTVLTSGNPGDVLLVKRDEAGAPVWAKSFGSTDQAEPDFARGVAVDGASSIILTGGCDTGINFGGNNAFDMASGANGFLAKLMPDGTHLWSVQLPLTIGNAVAVNDQNQVFLAGEMNAQLVLPDNGAQTKTVNHAGGADALVARVNGNGNAEWGRSFGDSNDQHAHAVAASGSAAVATGDFEGNISFDPSNTTAVDAVEGLDAWLVKLRADGTTAWRQHLGGAGDEKGVAVGADPVDGDVVVGVQFTQEIAFDGMTYTASGVASGDIFLASYDGMGGPRWFKHLSGGTEQEVRALHVDKAGRTFVTGYFEGTLDIDGTNTLISGNRKNIFVVVLDADGAHLYSWVHAYDGHDQVGTSIATDACNNVVLGGTYDGRLDLGGSAVLDTPGGGQDVLVGKLRPSPALP